MDMERMFMSAGIITAIVLCLVGVIKSPFGSFKKSHPKIYKAIFTILSILLSVGVSIIDETYISFGKVLSVDFAVKVTFVTAGVFCGYGGIYEGLGVKDLCKAIVSNINKMIDNAKSNKKEKSSTEDQVDEDLGEV